MYENSDAINLYNQMVAMGEYYSSGRSVYVDPAIIMEDVLSKIPVKQSDVILDAGCGTGVITFPLSRLCKQVYAVDAGESIIEAAKKRCAQEGVHNIDHRVANVLHLPFEDNFFNHVIIYGVIHYMDSEENINACVREVIRVCKPGGRILIAEIPDQRARQEFDQREKTPEERRILQEFNVKRAEYDRLFKENVVQLHAPSSMILDCQRIVEEASRWGCEGAVLRQDIRQPLSLTRRDVLLTKKLQGSSAI